MLQLAQIAKKKKSYFIYLFIIQFLFSQVYPTEIKSVTTVKQLSLKDH